MNVYNLMLQRQTLENCSMIKHFQKLFSDHPYINIQKEVGVSSWFGFSLVLNETSPITRRELVNILDNNSIECRPIVTGNFLKNAEVLDYFDFEISGTLENSEYMDKNGLFVGNSHVDLLSEITFLRTLMPRS